MDAIASISEADFAKDFDHSGSDFHTVLAGVHKLLNPRSYLEIGTCTGASLSQVSCASIAIDPIFQLDRDVIGNKPQCLLYRMGSDEFFRDQDPSTLLGCEVDLVFLDGMHFCEFLLRDFLNIEKHCKRNSIIFIHDCIPTDIHIARRHGDDHSLAHRSNHPTWWAGDLWKVVKLLKHARPDLSITAYNAPPTGLIAVTNLDPLSRTLENEYSSLLTLATSWKLTPESLRIYTEELNVESTELLSSFNEISKRFWL